MPAKPIEIQNVEDTIIKRQRYTIDNNPDRIILLEARIDPLDKHSSGMSIIIATTNGYQPELSETLEGKIRQAAGYGQNFLGFHVEPYPRQFKKFISWEFPHRSLTEPEVSMVFAQIIKVIRRFFATIQRT